MSGKKRLFLWIFFLILISSPRVFAEGERFQSSAKQTALIEMYGSEGCSSCPPADEWVSALKNKPGLWKEFVPVTFHVDYWDSLGWKDPLASPVYTQRQSAYVEAGKTSALYTPGFLANGREWRPNREIPSSGKDPGILTVEALAGNQFRVVFLPLEPGSYEAHAALLGFDLKSDVKRGENAGRILTHDFAVLAYKHEPLAGNPLTAAFELSSKTVSKPLGIAVWVTRPNDTEPLQTAGGYLKTDK